jgi:hypothetical protein
MSAKKKPHGKHLFQPGQSGNPSGRPKGAPDIRIKWKKQLYERGAEIIDRCIDLAMGGDPTCMKLCVERLILKPRGEPIDVNLLIQDSRAPKLLHLSQTIVNLVSEGQMSPEDGQIVAGLLEGQRKLVEHEEVNKRLGETEQKVGEAIKWKRK